MNFFDLVYYNQKVMQQQNFEFIEVSDNPDIHYIDKDSHTKIQQQQKKIDYQNFSFEEYYNQCADKQTQLKQSQKKIETSIVRKPSKQLTKESEIAENEDKIVMKGYLDRQTQNIVNRWEKRYCLLTLKQLFCFQDENRHNLISCINIKLLQCSVNQQQQLVRLYYCIKNPPIVFKAETIALSKQWAKQIKHVIDLQANSTKIYIKFDAAAIYSQKNLMTQQEFIKQAETCDILLMKTKDDKKCAFQRFVTHSQYDHIALVIKFNNKEIHIFESNADEGVQMYSWENYINRFNIYQMVSFRKLIVQNKQTLHSILVEFAKQTLGYQYDIGAIKLLKQWSSQDKSKRSYFCSQLAAKTYKKIGLLQKEKASARYWPIDFTERGGIRLLNGAVFGKEKVIILNSHTNKYH